MKQEYALILAQLQLFDEPRIDTSDVTRKSSCEHYASLFDEDVPPLGYPLNAEEIALRFLEAGMIDHAIATAGSLKVDMSLVFSSLAGQCLRLSRIPDDEMCAISPHNPSHCTRRNTDRLPHICD